MTPTNGTNSGSDSTPLPEQNHSVSDDIPRSHLGSGVITALLDETDEMTVYEIRNEHAGCARAVYVLSVNASAGKKKQCETEMTFLCQLKHPNIQALAGAGRWQGRVFYEVEKPDGPFLGELIREKVPLPPVVAAAIGLMVSDALRYMHAENVKVGNKHFQGVLHRSINPSAVMLRKSGAAILTGFGLAAALDAPFHRYIGTQHPLLPYFAPETLKGGKAGPECDIYSLGLLLYEMLSGKQAFSAADRNSLVKARMANDIVPLLNINNQAPPLLAQTVETCLRLEPEKRFHSARELHTQIETAFKQLGGTEPAAIVSLYLHGKLPDYPESAGQRPRRPYAALLLAVSVLLGLGAISIGGYVLIKKGVLSNDSITHDRQSGGISGNTPGEKPRTAAHPPAITPGDTRSSVPAVSGKKAAPAKKTGAAPRQTSAFIRKLTEKHGTSNLVEILRREVRQGNWTTALSLHDTLPENLKRQDRVRIYRLRALAGFGNVSMLETFFAGAPVDDGEYHMEKARHFYTRQDYGSALKYLDLAEQTLCRFMDNSSCIRAALYIRGLTMSALYNRTPTPRLRKEALDSWVNVRFAFREQPDHAYYQEADGRIRNLSE